jgi:hypothetical protein
MIQQFDTQNPERSTVNNCHKITMHELIQLINNMKLKEDVCRVGRLCEKAIHQTTKELGPNN